MEKMYKVPAPAPAPFGKILLSWSGQDLKGYTVHKRTASKKHDGRHISPPVGTGSYRYSNLSSPDTRGISSCCALWPTAIKRSYEHCFQAVLRLVVPKKQRCQPPLQHHHPSVLLTLHYPLGGGVVLPGVKDPAVVTCRDHVGLACGVAHAALAALFHEDRAQ